MITIPPSIETYLLISGISLMVPTSYKVTPASPTIDRPGSIPISGASIPRTLISDFIASVISLIPLSIGKLSSPSTYLIPKPPPSFNNSP